MYTYLKAVVHHKVAKMTVVRAEGGKKMWVMDSQNCIGHIWG